MHAQGLRLDAEAACRLRPVIVDASSGRLGTSEHSPETGARPPRRPQTRLAQPPKCTRCSRHRGLVTRSQSWEPPRWGDLGAITAVLRRLQDHDPPVLTMPASHVQAHVGSTHVGSTHAHAPGNRGPDPHLLTLPSVQRPLV